TGLLASAPGATVFLDEVGDLARAGQAMLLRFLQERKVRPLGGSTIHRVDVRVIASTNRTLGQGTREARGRRADLYDRLGEGIVRAPPLRQRRADIVALAEHFLTVHACRHGMRRPRLSEDATIHLARHDWPCNVRELEPTMSRAV